MGSRESILARIRKAQGRSGATPYVRWGNTPLVLLALFVCGLYALRHRKGSVAA